MLRGRENGLREKNWRWNLASPKQAYTYPHICVFISLKFDGESYAPAVVVITGKLTESQWNPKDCNDLTFDWVSVDDLKFVCTLSVPSSLAWYSILENKMQANSCIWSRENCGHHSDFKTPRPLRVYSVFLSVHVFIWPWPSQAGFSNECLHNERTEVESGHAYVESTGLLIFLFLLTDHFLYLILFRTLINAGWSRARLCKERKKTPVSHRKSDWESLQRSWVNRDCKSWTKNDKT